MKESIPPPSSPRQLRFLVIGAGSRGNAYARAVTTVTPGVIHAVAEPNKFKRREFGRNYIWGTEGTSTEGQEFADWREWVNWEIERRKRASQNDSHNTSATPPAGVDGVFICTLDETHVEIIQVLAPLNLHILCEKPLALSLNDCLTVYRTLQPPQGDSQTPAPPSNIFSIGHVLRYSPYNILLRKLLLSDRAIGDIVSLEHCEPVDIEDVFSAQGASAAESHLLSRLAEDYDRGSTPDSAIASRPWYGRCVYEADNNVCDDQVVTIAWDDENTLPHRLAKTASFHMVAPTEKLCERRGRVYGTTGEIA
ncbi:hypothetical protein BGZ90_005391, partial [Linnemannia elongata]